LEPVVGLVDTGELADRGALDRARGALVAELDVA